MSCWGKWVSGWAREWLDRGDANSLQQAFFAASEQERAKQEQERQRQHSRLLRLQLSLIVGLLIFLVAVAGLAAFGFYSRNEATINAGRSESLRLADQAQLLLQENGRFLEPLFGHL